MLKKLLLTTLTLSSMTLFANDIELTGTVISDNEKLISSRNMGFVKNVYVSEGSMVKKGELLYEIDSSSIDSNKQEVLANIEILNNQLNNIKTNYERYKRLYSQDLVSKYEVEQLELNLLNTKNMLSITKAKLNEVNAQYDYLKIKAPNNGIIIQKTIKAGEMAIPGMPALILSDLSNLKIKTEVAESDLNSIKINQEVKVEIPSQNISTTGKIDSIIPNVNSSSHSFVLKISFEKNENVVYPGMYSKIYIKKK